LFAPSVMLRKLGFFGAIFLFVVFLLSNFFAFQQKQMLENHKGAIIISPSVNVKKTPTVSGNDAFVIHEGTRVDITDTSIKDWYSVRLADGREGWILVSQVEKI